MAAYYWVDSLGSCGIPTTALGGGEDIDGHQIYVGRAHHRGDILPAKVIPGKRVAYVAHDGLEHAKDHFEVLCEQRFVWVDIADGDVPEEAVEGGRTANGEPLYIGRVKYLGSNTVGKVSFQVPHWICSIPFGGKELPFREFEILVLRS